MSANRGYQTIGKFFANGFTNGILVHDCWKPHFNAIAKGHQICIAHILRELEYFTEKRNSRWTYDFARLLHKALALKKKMVENPNHGYTKQVYQIQEQKTKLLKQTTDKKEKKLKALIKRLKKYEEYIFTFLTIEEVPLDNNASERAIRNLKVKLKVSGLFRSMNGATDYAIFRSVIDTAMCV